MDPIFVDTDEIIETRDILNNIIEKYPYIKSYHDFRIVGEQEAKKLIFDIVIDPSCLTKGCTTKSICAQLEDDIHTISPNYNCIITVDVELG